MNTVLQLCAKLQQYDQSSVKPPDRNGAANICRAEICLQIILQLLTENKETFRNLRQFVNVSLMEKKSISSSNQFTLCNLIISVNVKLPRPSGRGSVPESWGCWSEWCGASLPGFQPELTLQLGTAAVHWMGLSAFEQCGQEKNIEQEVIV